MKFDLPKRRKPTRPFGMQPMKGDGIPLDGARPASLGHISKYRQGEYADGEARLVIDRIVKNMRLLGYGGHEIAHCLGIGERTLDGWLKEFPSLRDAWDEGGDIADAVVARALYKRAVGYQYSEQKGMRVVPPDPAACQYWLNNRQKQLWQTSTNITGLPAGTDFPPPSIHVHVVDSPPRSPLIEGKANGHDLNGHANGYTNGIGLNGHGDD